MLGTRFSEILCICIERGRERGEKERNSQDTCNRREVKLQLNFRNCNLTFWVKSMKEGQNTIVL